MNGQKIGVREVISIGLSSSRVALSCRRDVNHDCNQGRENRNERNREMKMVGASACLLSAPSAFTRYSSRWDTYSRFVRSGCGRTPRCGPMMLRSWHSRACTGFQITASRTRFECASLTGKLTEGRFGLVNIIDIGRDHELE